jgi:hypothetical protein
MLSDPRSAERHQQLTNTLTHLQNLQSNVLLAETQIAQLQAPKIFAENMES